MKIKEKLSEISENDRIIYINVLGAFCIKGLSLIISLFTMPAYMRYFSDNEVLGVWFTVLSVLTWILNFDLGIGNGLRNKLTMALAQGDEAGAKKYISSAYMMIGCIVICILFAGNLLIPYCNWNAVFNISTELVSVEALNRTVMYAFWAIMLQFIIRLISSVIYAMQKSALNNLLSLFTSVLLLAFALFAPCGTAVENLQMFALGYLVCANGPSLIATVWIFYGPMKHCRPSLKCFESKKAKAVLSLGGVFFICQILYMIIANTNEFFITQYTSPQYVVEYQAYNRLFSLGSMLYMLALTPIWSAVSKALAENNFAWLKKINRVIRNLSILAILCEFVLIIFLQFLMNFWLGENSFQVDYSTAIIFALYGSAMIYQSGVSTMTNGIGRMHIQAICYAVGVVFKFIFIHVGIEITGSWSIVVLANALILVPYCIVQQIDMNKFLKKNSIDAKD